MMNFEFPDADFDMTLPQIRVPLEGKSDSSSDSDDSEAQKEFESQILGERFIEEKNDESKKDQEKGIQRVKQRLKDPPVISIFGIRNPIFGFLTADSDSSCSKTDFWHLFF